MSINLPLDAKVPEDVNEFSLLALEELLSPQGLTYGVVQPGNHDGAGVPLLKAGDIAISYVNTSPSFKISAEKHMEHSRTILEGGELLMTLVGTPGLCAIAPEEARGFNVVRAIGVMKLRPNFCPRYVMYALQSPLVQWKIRSVCNTTVQETLNLSDLRKIEIPVPPIGHQRAIAHVLGSLDDKIALNRKTTETLEALAKALFKSWFVDFDPVKAKAEGRPTGLPDDISALFPDSFEDSELGDNPTGWKPVTLGSLADVDKGVSYKGEFLSESEGLPMLNLGCFGGQGIFRAEKVKFYNGDYREKHVVQAGDLLLANTDMTQNRVILGSPIVAEPWRGHSRFLFSHHVFALRLKPDSEYLVRFLYLSLLRPEFRQIAAGHATGTTVLALPKDGVIEFRVMLPGEPLLRVFAAQVRVLYERVALLRSESETLAAIRDTLLPKLISGDIRVPDAEAAMEAVAL